MQNALESYVEWIEKHFPFIRKEELAFVKDIDPQLLAFAAVEGLQAAVVSTLPVTNVCKMIGKAVDDHPSSTEEIQFRIGYMLLYILAKKGILEFAQESTVSGKKALRAKLFKDWKVVKGKAKAKRATPKVVIIKNYEFVDELIYSKPMLNAGTQKTLPQRGLPLEWESASHPHYGDLVTNANRGVRRKLNRKNCPAVFRVVNEIQSTPFAVNNWVLNKVDKSIKDKSFLTFKEYRDDSIHVDKDLRYKGRCYERDITISLAKEYSDAPFYCAVHLDHRMRLYYSTSYLNFGGGDLQKGILLYGGTGKKLGVKGWNNLLCAAVSNLGEDKISRKAQLDLAEGDLNNEGLLGKFIDVGSGKDDSWKDADKPVQYLAICREIYLAYDSGDELSYVSNILLGNDASTSGPQLIGAAMMDPVVLELTNTVASEEIADLYSAVGNAALRRFKVTSKAKKAYDAVRGDLEAISDDFSAQMKYFIKNEKLIKEAAPVFVAKISKNKKDFRSWVKTPVMIIGYSSQEWNIAETIFDENILKHEDLNPIWCKELADAIYKAYEDALPGCFKFMKGAKKFASVLHRNDVDLDVTGVYTKFPFMTNYKKPLIEDIRMTYLGKDVEFSVIVGNGNRDYQGLSQAIAPSSIHNGDAELLFKTIDDFSVGAVEGREKVGPSVVNHDAFYTLAADSCTMADTLRYHLHDLSVNYNLINNIFENHKDLYNPVRKSKRVIPASGKAYYKRWEHKNKRGEVVTMPVCAKSYGIRINPVLDRFDPMANEFNFKI